MKIEKIGTNSLVIESKEYKTTFYMDETVKTVLQKSNISTSTLIPDTYAWYETELFELINKNPKIRKFKTIYSLLPSNEKKILLEGELSGKDKKGKTIKINYYVKK